MASGWMKAAGKSSLDMPMAALAAASVGFALFAMPETIFSSLVRGSGMPNLVAAAEPPLGATARLVAVALASVGAFLLVWLGLRALGQKPPTAKIADTETENDVMTEPNVRRRGFAPPEASLEAPRIRRADAHPDAPSRRPLFAGSDLGEPLDDIDLSQDRPEDWLDSPEAEEDQWPEPLPGFITDTPASPDQATFEAEAAQEEETAEAVAVDEDAIESEVGEEHSSDTDEAFGRRSWTLIPQDEDPAAAEPEYEEQAEPVAELPQPEEEIAAVEATDWIEQFEDEPQPDQSGEASLSEMMHRLERGLGRRERVIPADTSEAGGGSETVPMRRHPGPVDDRLRSALDDLQKMASRSGQA